MKSFVASSALVACAMAVSLQADPANGATTIASPAANAVHAPSAADLAAKKAAETKLKEVKRIKDAEAKKRADAEAGAKRDAAIRASKHADAKRAAADAAGKAADAKKAAADTAANAPGTKRPSTVAKPAAKAPHTAIPCLAIPTVNEAWTIFTKIDGDNSMTVTAKELEEAGKALSELNDGKKNNFDPAAAKAIRDAVAAFAKKHRGEIPLGAAIQGLQDGVRELNERSGACKAPKGVNAAAAAIKHFKMFDPVPCMSIPSHGQAQTIFNHIDQVETKDGKVTMPEMEKAMAEVGQKLAGMGKNFDPKIVNTVGETVRAFVKNNKGEVTEAQGIQALQEGVRALNKHTGSCKAVGVLPGVRSADVAQAAISHWKMNAPVVTMTGMATAPDASAAM